MAFPVQTNCLLPNTAPLPEVGWGLSWGSAGGADCLQGSEAQMWTLVWGLEGFPGGSVG